MQHSIQILSGLYKNKKLWFKPHEDLRPTCHRIRQAIFNTLIHRFYSKTVSSGNLPLQGEKVLDLFSGLGGYGFESLSLGAERTAFIESSPQRIPLLYDFSDQLRCRGRADIFCTQWPKYPGIWKVSPPAFNLVFMDPPYATDMQLLTRMVESVHPWMAESGLLVLEFPQEIDAPEGFVLVHQKKWGAKKGFFYQKIIEDVPDAMPIDLSHQAGEAPVLSPSIEIK